MFTKNFDQYTMNKNNVLVRSNMKYHKLDKSSILNRSRQHSGGYQKHADLDLDNHLSAVRHLNINLSHLGLTNSQIQDYLPKILNGLSDCDLVTLHLHGSDFEGGIFDVFDEIARVYKPTIHKFEILLKLEEMKRWSERGVRETFKPRIKRESVLFHV